MHRRNRVVSGSLDNFIAFSGSIVVIPPAQEFGTGKDPFNFEFLSMPLDCLLPQ